jgi:hypothetical protein
MNEQELGGDVEASLWALWNESVQLNIDLRVVGGYDDSIQTTVCDRIKTALHLMQNHLIRHNTWELGERIAQHRQQCMTQQLQPMRCKRRQEVDLPQQILDLGLGLKQAVRQVETLPGQLNFKEVILSKLKEALESLSRLYDTMTTQGYYY